MRIFRNIKSATSYIDKKWQNLNFIFCRLRQILPPNQCYNKKCELKHGVFYMEFKSKHLSMVAAFCLASVNLTAQADQAPIINNNVNNGSGSSPCYNGMSPGPAPSGIRPGTYVTKNADGSSNTQYTTGDKQPYIVDNNCGQQNIQPYIQPVIPGPRR